MCFIVEKSQLDNLVGIKPKLIAYPRGHGCGIKQERMTIYLVSPLMM